MKKRKIVNKIIYTITIYKENTWFWADFFIFNYMFKQIWL